jgi:hypothetical protein
MGSDAGVTLDFVHHQELDILEDKTFLKQDMVPSSD